MSESNSVLNAELRLESRRRTRRSFLAGAVFAVGSYDLYRALSDAAPDESLQHPLRSVLRFNQRLSRAIFGDSALAPTYPLHAARELRVNGNFGLKEALAPDSYRLQVVGVDNAQRFPEYTPDVTAWEYRYAETGGPGYTGHDTKTAPKASTEPAPATTMPPAFEKAFAEMRARNGNRPPRGNEEAGKSASTLDPRTPGLLLPLSALASLPAAELVTQFKCIEGWSEIVHWQGFRLRDFIARYPPARLANGRLPRFVYMETPNGDYYCGFSLADCQHPQSLLVTAMSGRPLEQYHGAPLRLHMPIKYGYKQIKRIGLIAYTDDQPDDYWTKLGYDWYAGL